MGRFLLLALLMVLSINSRAQQTFSNPAYSFVYKLDSAEANLAFTKRIWDTICFFRNKIDSFIEVRPKLKFGTYLIAKANENKIEYSLYTMPFGDIKILSFNEMIQIRIYDTLGNDIQNAKLKIEGENVPFDSVSNCFQIKTSHRSRKLFVSRGNDFIFGELSAEHYDYNDYNYNYHSYPPTIVSHGYFIVNQPKYLPGDTVKMKAYILKPNGKAYKKSLYLYLSDKRSNYKVQLAKVDPITPGAFVYQFRIPDSLKIDRNYTLEFIKYTGDLYSSTNFNVEEYKLRNSSYHARIEKETIYKGEKLKFYAKASDANDLPIFDARVRVRIKMMSYENFTGKFLFVPDVWREKMFESIVDLDISGETEIEIPPNIFPELDMQCSAEISFSNPEGELKTSTFRFNILQQKEYYTVTCQNNLLKIQLISNGENKPAKAILKGFYRDRPIFSLPVDLPYEHPILNMVDTYELYDSLGKKISAVSAPQRLNETVFMEGLRSNDSISIVLVSPFNFLVNYQVYKDDKLILKGSAKSFDYRKLDTSWASYNIIYNFYYHENSYLKEEVYSYLDKTLDVKTNFPQLVYPGQKLAVEVGITDNERLPVKNVNLTAYALNAQFGNIRTPYLKYFGSYKDKILDKGNAGLNLFGLKETSGIINKVSYNILLFSGLMHQADYRLMYPNDSLFISKEKIAFKEPELLPFVVANGKRINIYAIYIDDKPVYREGTNTNEPIVIVVPSGNHNISIRTRTAVYTTQNLLFSDSTRYVLSFDTLCLSKRIKKNPSNFHHEFSPEEKSSFEKYTLQFEDQDQFFHGTEVMFVQKGNVKDFKNPLYRQLIYEENRYHQYFYGPFQHDSIHIFINKIDSFVFIFEPGYKYIYFQDKIRKEPLDSFYSPFDLNFFRGNDIGFSSLRKNPLRLILPECKKDSISNTGIDETPIPDENCLGSYLFEPEYKRNINLEPLVFTNLFISSVRNIWAINLNNEERSMVSDLNAFSFEFSENGIKQLQLDTGFYDMYFISDFNKIAIFKSVKINAGGVSLLRLDTLDFVLPCSYLFEVVPRVKKLSELYIKRTHFEVTYRSQDYVRITQSGRFIKTPLSEKKANLSGSVFDEAGNILQNVIITLEQSGTVKGISFSNEAGSFLIKGINAGNYSLRFSRFGSCITILKNVKLQTGISAQLNIKLNECGFAEILPGKFKPIINERTSLITKVKREQNTNNTKEGFGSIRGMIRECKTKKPMEFVSIVLQMHGITKASTYTDEGGSFAVDNLSPGIYTLHAIYTGYGSVLITDIYLREDEERFVDFMMNNTTLEEVVVRNTRSLIDRGGIKGSNSSGADVLRQGTRSINKVAGVTLGVESRLGVNANFRGSRSDATAYYIDGVRVQTGQRDLPANAIGNSLDEIQTGGTPMQLGDLNKNVLYQMAEDKDISKTRETFRDYAYWVPNLVTNKEGKAYFTITFPDNITKWRSFIIAMNEQLKTSVFVHDIRAFKPLAANLFLPRFAIEGDRINLKGRIVNYTHEPINIQTNFLANDSVISSNNFKVNEFKIETRWVQPANTDTLKFAYALKTDFDYKDAEKYILPVFPNGVVLNQFKHIGLTGDTTVTFITDSIAETQMVLMNNYTQLIRDEISRLQAYKYGCTEQTTSKLKALLIEKKLCKLLADSFTKNALINTCINKLESFQQNNGSWGWFSRSYPEIWLTNYVLETLLDANRLGFKSDALIKGIKWLKREYKTLSASDKIKSLALLFESRAALDYKAELSVFDENNLPLFDRLQITLLKQQMEESHFIGFVFTTMQKDANGGIYWNNPSESIYRNKNSATLLAYQVLKNEHVDSVILLGIIHHFFNEHVFETGVYRNTLESAQVLQTMAADIARYEYGNFKTTIHLNGNLISDDFPVKRLLHKNTKYTITKTGAKARMFVYKKIRERNPVKQVKYFEIESYFTQDGKRRDSLQLNLITNLNLNLEVKRNSEFIMIEIPVPASCNFANKNISFKEDYSEFYKDRLVLFFRKMTKGTYTFTLQLEPRFEGSFTLLPVVVNNMYDVEITGNNESKKVIIMP
ncbi:MAG: carboxypeptidase regulatory-like domain-containing protein [Bacteroidota bacterium]|nr:carboxypeptidase regulatory-like domain-containing protein [Bacteroidota bacterium]